MMKHVKIALVIFFLSVGSPLFTQEAAVSYLEGEPEIRRTTGVTEWLDFGTTALPGEQITTGSIDYVELNQAGQATIKIQPDTIFSIQEIQQAGRTERVLTTAAGSVSYRFNQITGREPRVGTTASVAGIRGTELTVYAGTDGSSLFLVDSGLVEVTSAGESVELAANEGVEVAAGQAPGEKFEIIGRAMDFESWSDEKEAAFLEDPLATLADIRTQLREYYGELASLEELYGASKAIYDDLYAELTEAVEKYGRESAEAEAVREKIQPVASEATVHAFNIRYYALTILSMRRYVLGNLYMEMKTRYILDTQNTEFRQFQEEIADILQEFEGRTTPHLVPVDI